VRSSPGDDAEQVSGLRRRLSYLRDLLLDELTMVLLGDLAVRGIALVGSLGRGTQDEWSDIDILMVVADDAIPRFRDQPADTLWGTADLLVDARHNSPAGTTSAATIHLRAGLPFRVDWYAYPQSLACWPCDARVVHEGGPLPTTLESFTAVNSVGARQLAVAKTPDEVRVARLSMVPIAGKYVARRLASAGAMIEFLGGNAPPSSPVDQLRQLRAVTGRLSRRDDAWLSQPVHAFLNLVEEAIV
jgi:hypothetical protein